MKTILLYATFLLTVFYSCNLDKNRHLSKEEVQELQKAHNDSIIIMLDSLYKTSIYVPPLYDKETFDSATTIQFFELAKQTQGELKLLVNSKLISLEIINIIKSVSIDNSDILILMDKTGSMSDDIENVKKGLIQIIDALNVYKNVRVAIALYGDKNIDGSDWFSFRNFEKDYSSIKQFISNIQVTGGGDYPESVYDGFFKSCEQGFWKSDSKRMIILIGDAPPLEKPLSDFAINDVIKRSNDYKIRMNFYPIVVTPTFGEEARPQQKLKHMKKEELFLPFTQIPPLGS